MPARGSTYYLAIYLGIFSPSLKILNWRSQFWVLNFFDLICLSISLFLPKHLCFFFVSKLSSAVRHTCLLFNDLHPSQHFGLLKESHACEKGERKHRNIWNCLRWAICVQCCLRAKIISVASVTATGQYQFRDFSLTRDAAKWIPHSSTNTEQSL